MEMHVRVVVLETGGWAKVLRSRRAAMGTLNVAGLRGGSTGSGLSERNPAMVTSRVFSSPVGHTLEGFCKLEKKGS